MKRIGTLALIFLLIFGGITASAASRINIDSGTTVVLHNASSWYIKNDVWKEASHNTEKDESGIYYVSVDDFRTIFGMDIQYNYDDLSIWLQHNGQNIWQGLGTAVAFINGAPYAEPAPYISAEGGAVMVPVEVYASVFGYTAEYSATDDYLPGKLTLTLPPHSFTISKIEVNKAMQLVTVYGTDSVGTTLPLKYFVCSTGYPTDLTPDGRFTARPLTYAAAGNPWYYFKEPDCWILYCTQVYGDVCFHSIPFNQYGAGTLSSSGYSAIGSPASHGCIRLMIEDARFIWENCSGVPVVISEGYQNDTLRAIKKDLLKTRPSYQSYVKTLLANY